MSVTELKPDPKLMESPEHKAAAPGVYMVLRDDLTAAGLKDKVPALPDVIQPVPTAIKPETAADGGKLRRVSYKMHQRLSDYNASYYVLSTEKRSFYMDALRNDPGDSTPRQEALQLATQTAAPPADAVLQTAEYEDQGGAPVFVARWQHVVRGIPVERDYIQVLVNGKTKKVFSHHRRWHAIDPQPRVR